MKSSIRWAHAALVVGLVAGCTRDVTIPPQPSAETFISGRVVQAVPGTDQSQALEGASVTVLSSDLHVATDALGTFTVGPLPEGTYTLYVVARGDNDTLKQRLVSGITTQKGATRSVGDLSVQENAVLAGKALIDQQSTGNAGVLVFLPGTDFITNTADNGVWTLRNLPAGQVRVSGFRTGFVPATTAELVLQGGVVTSASDLVLFSQVASAPPGHVAGSTIAMGLPDPSGTTVKLISATTGETIATVTVGADGTFSFPNVPPDLYVVVASKDGFPDVRLPNIAVGAGVDVTLSAPLVFAKLSDTNTPFDGGLGLSEVVDAGPAPIDAGVPDAGQPDVDAGQPDAGQPDAGRPVTDGGVGECFTDAECALGLLCLNQQCVNCDATHACRAGSTCVSGLCRKDCGSNAECPTGLVCTNGSCGPCGSSVDCQDSSLVCLNGACQHCQSRAQCPSGKACLPQGCGTCSADSECGAGSICELGVCLTGTCHTNLGCPSTESCLAHACTTCGQDTDCRLGQLCIGNACVQGDCRQAADCGGGQVCLNNLCGACGRDTDCGAGSICVPTGAGLRCQPGVCHTNTDCSGVNAGKVCDSTNQCVSCARTSDCADATKVCDPTAKLCVTGNCGTAADCTALGLGGEVCIGNACAACTQDTQCASGQLCLSGRCKAATCKDNSWCSNGTQLCELTTTNPAAAQYTCRPCAPVGTVNSTDCGGTNRVCDTLGTCHLGTCATQAQCTGGLACINYTCTSCSTDAQCGGNGLLCISNRCVTGNCHMALPDTNADCSSTQVCVNYLCSGNCRANTDCAGTVPNPGSNYCDSSTHACSACTTSAQCGGVTTGKVCAGGACVPGACTLVGATPNDMPCAPGYTCLANQCVQVGPMPLTSSPYTEPYSIANYGTPMMVSGQSQLYLSAANATQGSFSVAFDGSRSKLWRVVNSTGTGRAFGPFNGGLVMPAPGYPGGEIFFDVMGTNGNNVVAHRADTGAPLWTVSGSTQNAAISMVGGVPQLVRIDNSYGVSTVLLNRPDGLKTRGVGVPACGGNLNAIVGGTQWVYAICYNAVYGIDPINDTLSWVFPVTPSNSMTYAMLWRPPGLTGPAAGDLLTINSTAGSAPFSALFIPDVASGVPTPSLKISNPTFGSMNGPPFIDAQGAAYFLTGGKLLKLNLADGTTLANVTLPVSPATLAQAGDGTLVATYSIGSNLWGMAGMTVNNGIPGTVTLNWQVGASTSALANAYPSFSPIPAVLPDGGVYDGGVIEMVTATPLGAMVQVAALGMPGPNLTPKAPAWSVGGDQGNRMLVPAYQCQKNADCAGTQQCVLNRCVGNCQSATTCAAGLGCSLAVCGACSFDTSCRAGEVCNGGACYACDRTSNPNCCSSSAECGGSNGCVQGLCRAVPAPLGTGSWLKPIAAPVSGTYTQVLGTDGTLYVFDTSNVLHAYAPDGTPLWTSPAAPNSLYLNQWPMVMRVGTQDVLFVSANIGNVFFAAPVGPAAFGGWKTLNTSAVVGTTSVPAMSQGVFNASGSPKPALYMSSNGKLWALDAQAAAAGTFSVFWQQPVTGCTEPSALGGNWTVVGSDGTVYHVCIDGSVQAWNPDGQTSQPVGATRPGTLLWTSTPSVLYPASPAPRPAIGKVPSSSTDVLYLSQNANALSVLRVAAGGVASRTEVAASGAYGFFIDASGNAIAVSNQTPNIVTLTPTGTILGSSSGQYAFSGQNNVLTSDGLLWFVDNKNSPTTLAAVQFGSLATPTLAFRLTAPGGLGWDTSSWFTFVPQSAATNATGSAMLVMDTNLSGLGYTTSRMLLGFPSASGTATFTQWSTQCGDPQHRASLKTQ